ncbi:MAG: iron-containing alcohol dehydrogenase [Clostridium sp.]|nr:iron-containing alcohol dehydrogenase [Clostridium sp.]
MANMIYTAYCRTVQLAIKNYFSLIKWRQPVMVKGEKSLIKVADILKKENISSILMMVSGTIYRSGLIDELIKKITESGVNYVIYDGVSPNPTDIHVEEAYELYKQNHCQAILSIGGGSVIDCAKAVGARVVNPDKTVSKLIGMKVKRNIPTLIAVPTTSGTGTEATMYAVITDSKTSHKQGMGDPHLIPSYAVLDPTLTISVPKHITAFTGMDALSHAVECYLNNTYMTDALREDARNAVRLIHDNIMDAYNNGNDMVARENMQEGAYLAGRAFNRGMTAYVHSIGHTLGGLYNIPHGKAMAIILTHVLRKYGAVVYDKLADFADVCGIEGKDNQEKALGFITWIEETNKKMGIGNTFPQIQEKDINQMVTWAYTEGNPLYPAPVIWNKKEFEELIRELM